MQNKKVYFEDFAKGKEIDISIGKISLHDFTEADLNRYGRNQKEWKHRFNDACNTALLFKQEYNEKHGHPDLTGTGLWSDFDPLKQW
jgi:hypothetical protein